jgi:hypothetical protein
MTTYRLQLTLDGTALTPLTIEGDTTPEIAQAVHRHARGQLGSRSVTIRIAADGLTGDVVRGSTVVGEFALQAVADTPAARAEDTSGIRGGWTLTTLDHLARAVVSNNFAWYSASDREDLYSAAWHGIVEHLYSSDTLPKRNDLMEAGRRSLVNDVRDNMRHHGARRDGTNNGQKYALYWAWSGRAVPSPENGIVDRLALAQILPTLTDGQRRAIEALAATGDYQEAERLLGTRNSLKSQVSMGRRRFRKLWHEGEVPSKPWGVDRRAGSKAGELTTGSTALSRLRRRQRAKAA